MQTYGHMQACIRAYSCIHADPIGAILISIYIIYSWFCTGMEQLDFLVGRSADPEFLVRPSPLTPHPHPSPLTLTRDPMRP